MSDFTPAQMKAINQFLVNGGNKQDAMRKAGFSIWYAKEFFQRPDVVSYIDAVNKKLERKTEMDRAWLLEKLRTIIEAEPGELIEVDAKGRPSLNFNNLSPSLRKAISKITIDTQRDGGKYKKTKTKVSFDVPDRISAIKEAAVLLGIREEQHKINTDQALIDELVKRRSELAGEPKEEENGESS
jgi:hypothetical protein